jgi:hypothetical protein
MIGVTATRSGRLNLQSENWDIQVVAVSLSSEVLFEPCNTCFELGGRM